MSIVKAKQVLPGDTLMVRKTGEVIHVSKVLYFGRVKAIVLVDDNGVEYLHRDVVR